MLRLMINGSPRGEASNSRKILSWISEGISSAGMPAPEIWNLSGKGNPENAVEAVLSADEVILAFPLYTDSMPGIVAAFTNALAETPPERRSGKRVGYIVHSGFPESAQSEPLAGYLKRLSERLGFEHIGVVIKGGSEGLRLNPSSGKSKTADNFRTLGQSLAASGSFDAGTADALSRPRRLGPGMQVLFRILSPTGLMNFYWNFMLKKNGAYARRFDRPYAQAGDLM